MKQYDKITPEGTRDLLFEECDVRSFVSQRVSGVLAGHGYRKVCTPGMEFYDVFSSNSRSYPQESMYKLVDHHGRLLVMRPDCTTPIARLVTTKLQGFQPPFRLYYDQNVYRVTRSLSGGSDEIEQIGAELVGSGSEVGDLEVIAMATEALDTVGISDYRLEIGHIGFFKALISKLPVSDETKEEIRIFITTKNYPALSDLLGSLPESDAVKALKQLPRLFGGVEVFETAEALFSDPGAEEILNYLKDVYLKLCKLGLREKLIVDLGLVNENIYYTGVIFRAYVSGSGTAVLSGGRYDKLFEDFGEKLDATGFGLDVDTLAKALFAGNHYPKTKAPEVLVTFEEGYGMEAVIHTRNLMRIGMKSELFFRQKLEEAKEYARSNGIGRIDIVSDEIKSVDRF